MYSHRLHLYDNITNNYYTNAFRGLLLGGGPDYLCLPFFWSPRKLCNIKRNNLKVFICCKYNIMYNCIIQRCVQDFEWWLNIWSANNVCACTSSI